MALPSLAGAAPPPAAIDTVREYRGGGAAPTGGGNEHETGLIMLLHIYLEDSHYPLDISVELLQDATDLFTRMDADMDQGWQMGRVWVECPDPRQRCQIVADRLMGALESDNRQMVAMMGAYILWKIPGIKGVRIDTQGEMQETELMIGAGA